jgi:hypothetical protein
MFSPEDKRSFTQRQGEAIETMSKLINDAVDQALMFTEGVQYKGEPPIDEQRKAAFESGKKVMEYFKKGNNRLYFSDNACNKITQLYELISSCLTEMAIAMSGNLDIKQWNLHSKKLKQVARLRNEIFSEFRETLAKINN